MNIKIADKKEIYYINIKHWHHFLRIKNLDCFYILCKSNILMLHEFPFLVNNKLISQQFKNIKIRIFLFSSLLVYLLMVFNHTNGSSGQVSGSLIGSTYFVIISSINYI